MTGYDPDDVRAYQLSGSVDDIDEWLEKRRGTTAQARGVMGTPSRRPSIPSKRCEHDGFKFDSITEGERYLYLKADSSILHIDVHPVVSLPGGIRYTADFMVWDYYGRELELRVEEVKGSWILKKRKPASHRAFEIKRKLFDQWHPFGPLFVVTFDRKAKTWREV